METDRRPQRVVRETTLTGSHIKQFQREDLQPREVVQGGSRIGLFIDGDNLTWTINRLGYRGVGKALDYEKLLAWLRAGGNDLVQMTYYCTPGTKSPTYDVFLGKLMDLGFTVVKIPDKYIRNKRKKAPIDSVLSRDITKAINGVDEIVLMSGDGDFAYPIEGALSEGRKARIISGSRSLGREFARLRDSQNPLFTIVYFEDIFPQLSMELPKPVSVGPVLVVDNTGVQKVS